MSFNKIIIVGHLGRDPELRYTPQGTAVCNFSVATSEKRRDKSGEFQDIATWFRVTLWDKRAETAAKYLTKGSQVYVEGRIRVDEWTDRDGNSRYTLEVNGTDMQFIGSAAGRDGGYAPGGPDEEPVSDAAPPATSAAAAGGSTDDDIPF